MKPREIADACWRLPEEERAQFLDENCGDNDSLKLEVNLLLESRSFDKTVVGEATVLGEPTVFGEPTEHLDPGPQQGGSNFTGIAGRYRTIRPHARGGLGEVSVAADLELPREVALKEIQARFVEREASRARFILEAEITGGLEHPGIVPVYGLGTHPDGRPYYAMRFIQGEDLNAAIHKFHKDDSPIYESLEFRELIGRFLDVCQAIAYAHSRGVIHRDIKPSNIMLGKFGETLVVDWGLAKIVGKTEITETEKVLQPRSSGDSGSETQSGSAIGTPSYMSPEQAAGKIDQLGPATDIYSLGGTLYALLTGVPPVENGRLDVVLEKVCRGEIREPKQIKPGIPKPLDSVCRKALAISPSDRYLTAQELAEDLQRYLADEPVKACSESIIVKARRWMRKHPGPTAAIAASFLVGLVSLGVGNYLLGEKNFQLIGLNLKLEGLNTELSGKNEQLSTLNTELGKANTNLTIANKRAETREQEAIDAVKRFADSVANNRDLKNSPQLETLRKLLLKEPLEYFKSLKEQLQADQETRPESLSRLAEAGFEHARLTEEIGNAEDAIRVHREVLSIHERLFNENPNVTEYLANLAKSHNELGILLSVTGKGEEALVAFGEAVRIRKKLLDENPTVVEYKSNLAATQNNLAQHLSQTSTPEEAIAACRESLRIQEILVDENPSVNEHKVNLATLHDQLSKLLLGIGHIEEAMLGFRYAIQIRQKLVDENPTVTEYQSDLAQTHNNLGIILSRTGKTDEAIAAFMESLRINKKQADENPSVTQYQFNLALSHQNLGILLDQTGRLEEALSAFQESLRINQKLVDENPSVTQYQSNLANSFCNLGAILSKTSREEEARVSNSKGLNLLEKVVADHPELIDKKSELGALLHNVASSEIRAERLESARELLQRAISFQKLAFTNNPRNPQYRQFLKNHYTNLLTVGISLKDSEAISQSRLGFAEIALTDPMASELDSKLNAATQGATIESNEERLTLARWAYDTARFGLAAKLFREALEFDRKLAESRQTQTPYNAACAASLAGTGIWRDDPPLDEATKATWRKQAHSWLTEELDRWKTLAIVKPNFFTQLVGAPDKRVILQTLQHWQNDSDLFGVRGEEIDKLPEEERQGWNDLWTQVDTLLGELKPKE